MPSAVRLAASRSARSRNSRKVTRSSPKTIASRPGHRAAAASRTVAAVASADGLTDTVSGLLEAGGELLHQHRERFVLGAARDADVVRDGGGHPLALLVLVDLHLELHPARVHQPRSGKLDPDLARFDPRRVDGDACRA